MRHAVVKEVNDVFTSGFNRFRPPRSIGLRLLGDCMLKTIKDLRMTEDDFVPADAKGMDNMSYGSVHEIWILERFKDAGLLKHGGKLWEDMQVNLRAEEGNGYMDAWVFHDGKDIPTEVKTKGSRDFDAIIAGKKLPDKAHIYQITIYGYLMKRLKNVNVETLWLVYMDREKHYEAKNGETIPRWEILEIPYDDRLGQKLYNRLVKLSEYKRAGTLPKKEPKSGDDPRCTWCSYKKNCWGESTPRSARKSAAGDRIAKAAAAKRRARPLARSSSET